ncbi:GDSL-type esterase/lipase family protein [Asticcacaulis solisilvae]|uniref:GDSL-type esterase/lipase family protein n=1 Tax=Asticcacaulis solisilvae TaxID=1217274 RepID=UPI003FD8C3F7
MPIFAAAAMMAMLASQPKAAEYGYRTVGRVQRYEEVETENAIVIPHERHQWPGIYWEAGFSGRTLWIDFYDTYNRFRLIVDGKPFAIIDKPAGPYRISLNTAGKHTVRLEKMTESQDYAGTFSGFAAPRAKVWPTPARARQIEFVGDSGVVGYGDMSETRDCTDEEHRVRTDVHAAWGPLTAKHFNADYEVNAFSGFGVVRAYGGNFPKAPPLPELYKYALFEGDPRPPVDDSQWHPQIIVIELGGNDFSAPVKPGERWATDDALKADFEASYVAFVKRLQAADPGVFVLLAEVQGPKVREEVEKVAGLLRAEGNTRVDTFHVQDFELKGCDWHFDAADHQRISQALIGYIDAHPELWQGR